MIQKRLILKGRVQEVTYRLKVKKIARKMKVLGTVENLDDETVEIFCECTDEQHFQEFKKKIDIKSENHIEPFVENIEESQLENAKLKRFTIIYENIQEDMLIKLRAGIEGMDILHTETKSMNVNMNNRFDIMDTKSGEISKNLKEINDSLKPFAEFAKRVLTDPDILVTIAKSLQKKKK